MCATIDFHVTCSLWPANTGVWFDPNRWHIQLNLVWLVLPWPQSQHALKGALVAFYQTITLMNEWQLQGKGSLSKSGQNCYFAANPPTCNCSGQTSRGGKVISEMQLLAVWQQRHNFFWSFDSFKMLHSFLFVRTFIVGGWDSDKYFGIAVVAREDCRWVIGVAN